MRKVLIDKDFLEREYYSGKTYDIIAKETGLTRDIITERAKEFGITSRSSGRKKLDVIGQKFCSLFVINEILENKGKHPKYLCMCDCGETTVSTAGQLIRGKQTCWNCRGKIISEKKWKGYGEISGEFWGKILRSAKIRHYNFDITIEQGWELFLFQNRRCALSGVKLEFYRSRDDRSKITASLDRINSLEHYTLDNVQWVHKTVNVLKMDLPEIEFIEWCRRIVEQKGKENDFAKTC